MGRHRKASTGMLSRQSIYNYRSELYELIARLHYEPAHLDTDRRKLRIEELKEILGPEVVPFRQRVKAQKIEDKESESFVEDQELKTLEEVVDERKAPL